MSIYLLIAITAEHNAKPVIQSWQTPVSMESVHAETGRFAKSPRGAAAVNALTYQNPLKTVVRAFMIVRLLSPILHHHPRHAQPVHVITRAIAMKDGLTVMEFVQMDAKGLLTALIPVALVIMTAIPLWFMFQARKRHANRPRMYSSVRIPQVAAMILLTAIRTNPTVVRPG